MTVKKLKRNIFQRLFGRPATELPSNNDFWNYTDGKVTLELAQVPDLSKTSGAVRLEDKGLPKKILVVNGEDGEFHAFHNKCTHAGRCLDPVPGTETVQCCSIGASTFDYKGKVLEGSTEEAIEVLTLEEEGGQLKISV